ncbi:MAG: capsular polysaccharide synthesis protein [Cyanobacteria bacterium J06635_1]
MLVNATLSKTDLRQMNVAKTNILNQPVLDGTTLPKVIWMMWWQGFDNAPELVKKCLISWQKHHPTWKICLLDKNNIDQFIDIESVIDLNRRDIPIQMVSNVLRLNLLKAYSGVWVDATCFCCRPLDDWLGDYASSGFFAFHKPGRDALCSNWFMASGKDCYLTAKLCDERTLFWKQNHFSFLQNRGPGIFIVNILSRFLNQSPRSTRHWFSFWVLKVLKLYPYGTFHHHFNKLVFEDPEFGRVWEQTQKYSSDIPHKLQRIGLLEPLSQDIKQEIDASSTPVYKLDWKAANNQIPEHCILNYLIGSL